jgi:hypothetical protein
MTQDLKFFLTAMFGSAAGIVLIAMLFFGFAFGMSKISETKIICNAEQEITKRGISCKILEIKDRGNTLKADEMISPPIDPVTAKDKTTTGKFVEIKFVIKNAGKNTSRLGSETLIDSQNRTFNSYGPDLEHWLKDNSSVILPGFEKKITQIFEVPSDAQDFKLKLKFWKSSSFMD